MRIGHLEKGILSILLKHGARTTYELAMQMENVNIRHAYTRQKAFSRTIKQLRQKNLITAKPYFKYEPHFILFYSNRFWAEGCYWRRYSGSGFFRMKTRPICYGHYHMFGLTHEGGILARAHATAIEKPEQSKELEPEKKE
jgi:hypothetical protein